MSASANPPPWLLPDWWIPNFAELADSIGGSSEGLALLARWIGQSVGLSLLVLLADLLLGAAILRVANVRLPARLRGAAMLALGSGVAGLTMFLLGWQRRLVLPWVLGITILGALAGLPMLRTRRGRWFIFGWVGVFRIRKTWGSILAVLAILPIAIAFLGDLAMPVLEYDSTMYHMAAARWYGDTHRIVFHGGIRFNALPHLPVLLYLRHLLLLGDDTLPKLLNLEFLLMLTLALAHAARRFRVLAWWGLLFLAASPVLAWVARLEYADWAMVCWFAVAAAWLAERRPSLGGGTVWLPGLVLGFAAASKLQGLVMAAGLGVSYLVAWRRWKPVLILSAGVVICGAPWWIRSWQYTGSPAYPFFLPGNSDAKYLFQVSAGYGMGTDPMALFLLPWRMVVSPPHLFADPFGFGLPLLVLVVVGVAVLLRRARFPSPPVLFWFLTFLLFFGFWFQAGQVTRYLAGVLPVMTMLFLAAVAKLRLSRWWLAPLALAAFVCQLPPIMTIRFKTLPPVTFAAKERILANSLPYYSAVRDLNRVVRPGERVYLWFCEETRYHVRAIGYGDWFGDYRYLWVREAGGRPDELVARLRGAGFRYILVDRERAAQASAVYSEEFVHSGLSVPGGPVPRGLVRLYDDDRYALWRFD